MMLPMLIIIHTIASMNYFAFSRKKLTSLVEITIMPMERQVAAKYTTVTFMITFVFSFMDNYTVMLLSYRSFPI